MNNNEQVSDFWSVEFSRMRQNSNYWTNNTLITDNISELISGTKVHWLPWLFQEYFKNIPRFGRVLSICCGDGAHELTMLKTGKVDFLHAFDISKGALESAASRFRAANIPVNKYKLEIKDVNDLDIYGHYDLVICAGAAHHVTNLEGLFSKVSQLLGPNGYFALLEYVGPSQFQWTDRQIDVINRILGCLDAKYLFQGRRMKFGRPSIEDMVKIDPSEAIRSHDILNILGRFFSFEYKRDYNGTIIHQMYQLINGDFGNKDLPDFDSIIKMVLVFEDILVKSGYLESDFTFIVSRPKTFVSA